MKPLAILEAITLAISIAALKVHMWCTIVLWACDMKAKFMCICSTYPSGAAVSVDSAPAMQALQM